MKITTVVNFILDESGSMATIKKSVIDGFNEYLNGLKQKDNNMLFSLTKFDSNGTRTPYVMSPLKDVEPLNVETFQPGAMTPLYDAVVETITKLEKKAKANQSFVVLIMTDGYENASRKHDQKCLQDLIHRLEHKGNWTFTFMGANQDAWAVAQSIGIRKGNTMSWQADEEGTQDAFRGMSASTMAFSASNSKGILRTANFYNDDEDSAK